MHLLEAVEVSLCKQPEQKNHQVLSTELKNYYDFTCS